MKIPRYLAKYTIPAGKGGARMNATAMAGPATAMGEMGELLAQMGEKAVAKQQEADDNAWISKTTADATRHWNEYLVKSQDGAGEGAAGFTERTMGAFTTWQENTLKGAPSDRARQLATGRIERLRTAIHGDAMRFEAGARRAHRLAEFDRGVDALSSSAFNMPDRFESYLAQLDGDIKAASATWMHPEDATARRMAAEATLATSALRGRIASDPYGVLQMLEAGAEGGDPAADRLGAQGRLQLISAARSEISRRDVEANAVRQGIRSQIQEVKGIIRTGFDPGDNRMTGLENAIAKIGDADLSWQLAGLRSDLAFQTEVRTWSPGDLQNWVSSEEARLDAGGVVSAEGAHRVELARDLLSTMRTEVARDPLSWANRAGIRQVSSLTLTGNQAEATMRTRVADALAVSDHYGIAPKFLTDEDRTQLKSALEGSGVDEKLAIVKRIREGFGNHAFEVLAEISGDAPVLVHAAGLAAGAGSPQAAHDALIGFEAIKAGNKILPKHTDMNIWADEILGSALGQVPRTRSALLTTAKGIYAARALRQGLGPNDEGELREILWKRSVQEAAGAVYDGAGNRWGGIAEWNDRQVLIPREIRADEFEDLAESLSAVDARGGLWNFEGAPRYGDGTPFDWEDLDDAYLIVFDHGRYFVSVTDPETDDPKFLAGDGPGGRYVLDLIRALPLVAAPPEGPDVDAAVIFGQ